MESIPNSVGEMTQPPDKTVRDFKEPPSPASHLLRSTPARSQLVYQTEPKSTNIRFESSCDKSSRELIPHTKLSDFNQIASEEERPIECSLSTDN